MKEILDHAINWADSYISALMGRKLCMFDVELGDLMGRPNAKFVHFHRMNIYNLDEAEKGLQLKQLTRPFSYEHEFVRRCVSSFVINFLIFGPI